MPVNELEVVLHKKYRRQKVGVKRNEHGRRVLSLVGQRRAYGAH